jgi:hypothetical protein
MFKNEGMTHVVPTRRRRSVVVGCTGMPTQSSDSALTMRPLPLLEDLRRSAVKACAHLSKKV